MGNIDNKEKEFAETLKYVTRLARENKNVISKEQVDDAFSELDLDEKQLQMVYEYLNAILFNVNIIMSIRCHTCRCRFHRHYLSILFSPSLSFPVLWISLISSTALHLL